MAARKQRGRAHPGIVLMRPSSKGRTWWRARYLDPEDETGKKFKYKTLPDHLTTEKQRVDWAKRESDTLAERRREIDRGAVRMVGTALDDVLEAYFDDHKKLRDKTLKAYKPAVDKLKTFAVKSKIKTADELTRPHLMTFRAKLAHEQKADGKRRSTASVNRELRATRTVLNYLVDKQRFARLSREDLRIALKQEDQPQKLIQYFRPHEIKSVLESALRHDAETLITREDEAALRLEAHELGISRRALADLRPGGMTPRYTPVAPMLAFALLTGARLGEIAGLTWKDVHPDVNGKGIATLAVRWENVKRKVEREIDLVVSPALRLMLETMKLASGGKGSVFGLTIYEAENAIKRLRSQYGAPEGVGWHACRRTCATYLSNMSAFGPWFSAGQLGHGIGVAQKRYAGRLKGLPSGARDLDTAMNIADVLGQVIARIGAPPSADPKMGQIGAVR